MSLYAPTTFPRTSPEEVAYCERRIAELRESIEYFESRRAKCLTAHPDTLWASEWLRVPAGHDYPIGIYPASRVGGLAQDDEDALVI